MATPVTFDYNRFTVEFPELAGINEASLLSVDASGLSYGYWANATRLIRNDGGGPIRSQETQADLLYLATAHIAKLFSPQTNGVPMSGGTSGPSPLVGRINSATEGSVSVQTEMPTQPRSAFAEAWWSQTPYGAKAWELLAPYRTMHYFGSPRRRTYNPPVWRGVWGSWGNGYWPY